MGSLSLTSALENFIYCLYETGELSPKLIRDRHYAFWQLYELRTVTLEIICNCLASYCYKTKMHFDGTMFNGNFLLVMNTALGVCTNHIKEMYYEDFRIPEVSCGPKYDGYTPDDNLTRLGSIILPSKYIKTDETISYKPFQVITSDSNDRIAFLINGLLAELRDQNEIVLDSIGDGHHPFSLMYRERRIHINILSQLYKDLAFKSKFDVNGDPVPDDKFLVVIKTPGGVVVEVFNGYHFNEFDLPVLETTPIDIASIITRDSERLDALHQENLKKILSLPIRQYYE